MRQLLSSILAVALITTAAEAQTVRKVPGDFPTIQAAINAAQAGDTVRVAPGIYVENISFSGKAIQVVSAAGADVTTIDGGLADAVVRFITQEGPGSILEGFTIRNGRGAGTLDGGGIRIASSSPTVRRNRIVNNTGCQGVGIAVSSGSPLIQGNIISDNIGSGCTGGTSGGGILLFGGTSAQILDNIISNNAAAGPSSSGAGISLWGAVTPVVRGNIITGNRAPSEGGGIYMVNFSTALIVQNVIAGNSSQRGGGVYWTGSNPGPTLTNNTIVDNDSNQGSAVYAGAGPAAIRNNIIVGKTGQAALFCENSNFPPVLAFNDVFSEQATAFGGACPNVIGSNGNISVLPNFVDRVAGNFRLLNSSAGIDAGDNTASALPGLALNSVPRILPSGGIVDMGAYEFAAATTSSTSANSLTFASQAAGTVSAPSDITLTNTGSATLVVNSVTVSGDFSQTNTCQTTSGIPVGQTCTISVRFAPNAGGPRSGQLVIAGNSGNTVISLSGDAVGSPTLSATYIAFNDQLAGSTSTATTLNISNNGSGDLNISSIIAFGDFTASTTCSATLSVGASCTVDIRFAPTSGGTRNGALVITSGATGSPHIVMLTGLGLAPAITFMPASIQFTNHLVGTTSVPRILTVANLGNIALSINSISTTGDFSETHDCGASLAVSQTCSISITFAPANYGTRTGTLSVADNQVGSPHTVALKGFGSGAVLGTTPTSVSFGNQGINTTSTTRSVQLRNFGDTTLTISSIVPSGEFSSTGTCVTIAPLATCTVSVTFSPTSIGPKSGTLTITDTAIGSPHVVPLSGFGVDVVFSPSSLNFSNVYVGTTSSTSTATFTNNSPNPVNIANISVSAGFSQQNACVTILDPGMSCSIQVTFSPVAPFSVSGTLSINDDALGSPHTLPLLGTGVIAFVSLSPTSLAFTSAVVGTMTPAQTVSLFVSGLAPLTISGISVTSDFTQTNNCSTVVPLESSCTINVAFSPTAEGDRAGSLTIASNASGNPHTVALTGTGLSAFPVPTIATLNPQSRAVGSTGTTLTITGSGFFPTSTVRWGGIDRPTTYVNNSTLTTTLSASDFATMATIPVTVSNPLPGGGVSNDIAFAVYRAITLSTRDLIYDRPAARIWASVPATAPDRANTLTPIDPATGTMGASVLIGSDPGKLAISDDFTSIYVALESGAQVRRFDVGTQMPGLAFAMGSDSLLGQYYARDIAVSPGNPGTIAISRKQLAGVAIYDNGVKRPVQTAPAPFTSSSVIEFSSSPSILYGYNDETTDWGFRTMSVDASGVTTTNAQSNLISGFSTDIQFEGGRVYSTNGRVIDPVSRTLLGTFSLPSPPDYRGVVADPSLARVFFLHSSSQFIRILAFDINTFTQIGSVTLPLPGTSLNPGSLVRWGSNGLAFKTGTQVIMFQIPESWLNSRATRDFNGDRKSDVLWRDTAGSVSLWQMNGYTIVNNSTIRENVWTGWTIVGSGDFNADGKADILWRDSGGDVVVWLMDGATITGSGASVNAPPSWTVAGVADFNADGKADILWRHTSGDVAMWLMNGTTIASNAVIANIWTGWTIAGTGDFDADGKADILWRSSTGDVALWLMNGTTIASSAVIANIWTGWTIAGTGDFDGDGRADILWRESSGDVALWLMNGTTITTGSILANIWIGWAICGTGDFNGDGKSDILWRDPSGNVAIWSMNGMTISSYALMGNVSDRMPQ